MAPLSEGFGVWAKGREELAPGPSGTLENGIISFLPLVIYYMADTPLDA